MIPLDRDLILDLLYAMEPTKEEVRSIIEASQRYIQSQWRDDDSPQSETTFGVHKAA
jgi:hypothetical protein